MVLRPNRRVSCTGSNFGTIIGLPYRNTGNMGFHMKTTPNIDETVMRRLREEAARRGTTMSSLVKARLRRVLSEPDPSVGHPHTLPQLPTWRSGGLGVDIANREALWHGADELLDCLCRLFLAPGEQGGQHPPDVRDVQLRRESSIRILANLLRSKYRSFGAYAPKNHMHCAVNIASFAGDAVMEAARSGVRREGIVSIANRAVDATAGGPDLHRSELSCILKPSAGRRRPMQAGGRSPRRSSAPRDAIRRASGG